jgi:hypothetical protein
MPRSVGLGEDRYDIAHEGRLRERPGRSWIDHARIALVHMVMVGMVMGVLPVGLCSFHVALHFSHDQAQQIGHFSRIPSTNAIANETLPNADGREKPRLSRAPRSRRKGVASWERLSVRDQVGKGDPEGGDRRGLIATPELDTPQGIPRGWRGGGRFGTEEEDDGGMSRRCQCEPVPWIRAIAYAHCLQQGIGIVDVVH